MKNLISIDLDSNKLWNELWERYPEGRGRDYFEKLHDNMEYYAVVWDKKYPSERWRVQLVSISDGIEKTLKILVYYESNILDNPVIFDLFQYEEAIAYACEICGWEIPNL